MRKTNILKERTHMTTNLAQEKVKKIKTFLENKGYEIGYHGRVPHTLGISDEAVLIRPAFNHTDHPVYTIGVNINTVIGYVIDTPYLHHDWVRVWEKPYYSQKELEEILTSEMEPKHCW